MMFVGRRRRFVVAVAVTLALTTGLVAARASGLMHMKITPPPVATEHVPSLAAFVRPETPADRGAAQMPSVKNAVASLVSQDGSVPDEMQPGTIRGDVRVLASGLGTSNRLIFAFRTTKGAVCLGLTGFTSGCLTAIPRDTPITITAGDPDQEGSGEGPILWGFANDDVDRVDVVVTGDREPAILGENVFFFQVDDASVTVDEISSVLVTLRDGHELPVPVAPARPILSTGLRGGDG
jgi:hypothetical protein